MVLSYEYEENNQWSNVAVECNVSIVRILNVIHEKRHDKNLENIGHTCISSTTMNNECTHRAYSDCFHHFSAILYYICQIFVEQVRVQLDIEFEVVEEQ
jgi:hypothetical protein